MTKRKTSKAVAQVLNDKGKVVGYLTEKDEEQGLDIALDMQGYTIIALEGVL